MDENTKEEKMLESVNVNVQIDYEQLATAIVKALKKYDELDGTADGIEDEIEDLMDSTEGDKKETKARRFFRKINEHFWDWCEKVKSKMQEVSATAKIFSLITFVVLFILGFFGLVLSYPIVAIHRGDIFELYGAGVFGNIIFYIILALAFIYSVMLIVASLEILISKDKNFIVAVFSALTSLAALGVALVALG